MLKQFLTQKKKLQIPSEKDKRDRPEKVDRIQLINLDTSARGNSSQIIPMHLRELQQMVESQQADKLKGLTIHKMKDLIQPGEIEIAEKGGVIEPNTKVIVRRLPLKEYEPIELEYMLDIITNDHDK